MIKMRMMICISKEELYNQINQTYNYTIVGEKYEIKALPGYIFSVFCKGEFVGVINGDFLYKWFIPMEEYRSKKIEEILK